MVAFAPCRRHADAGEPELQAGGERSLDVGGERSAEQQAAEGLLGVSSKGGGSEVRRLLMVDVSGDGLCENLEACA